MPQITLEYSANLDEAFDARALALRVHEALVAHADAQPGACKTRLVRHEAVVIGDGGTGEAMVHLDLRILTGRSDAQKQALGEAAIALLEAAIRPPAGVRAQLTCEVRELDRANYHKRLAAG